jgi:hypothetical protein
MTKLLPSATDTLEPKMKYLRLTQIFDNENVIILFSDELSINKLLDALHIPVDYVTSTGRFTFELNKYNDVVFKANMGPKLIDMPEFSDEDSKYLNMLFESRYSSGPKFVQIDDIGGVKNQYLIFNRMVTHKDLTDRMLKSKDQVLSAGFVSFSKDKDGKYNIKMFGESTSIGVKSNKENTTEVNTQFDPNKEEVVITLTTEIHDKLVELFKEPVCEGGPKIILTVK